MSHFSEAAKSWDTEETIKRNEIFSKAIDVHFPAQRSGLNLLDFGCGTGLLSTSFVERSDLLLGVDTTSEMLELFKKRFSDYPSTKTKLVNLEEHPEALEDKFDVIYSAMAFHHLNEPQKVLSLFIKSLRPGGKVMIIDLDEEDGSFHPDNKKMGVKHFGFSKETFASWQEEAGFSRFSHEIIHSISKNGREYKVSLSLFD